MNDRKPELPAESVLDGLTAHAWDGEAAVQYEVAIEMLSQQIAECSTLVANEQSKPSSDPRLLARLNELIDDLTRQRQELRSADRAAVQEILRTARQRIDDIRAL